MQNVIGIDVSKAKLDICALFDGKTRKNSLKTMKLDSKFFIHGL